MHSDLLPWMKLLPSGLILYLGKLKPSVSSSINLYHSLNILNHKQLMALFAYSFVGL